MSVSKLIANAGFNPDGVVATPRMTQRGEQDVNNVFGSRLWRLAEEGSLFVACNPTDGTGVAMQGATTTAWVATTPSILMVNNNTVASGINIYPEHIRLLITAAGTAAAALHLVVMTDLTNRYSTGGTLIAAGKPCSTAVGTTSNALMYYAATATAASSSVRRVGRAVLRGQIPVVNDQYTILFGSSGTANGHGTDGTTTIMNKAVDVPPVVLAPQTSLLVYLYGASMSASPTNEFEICYAER